MIHAFTADASSRASQLSLLWARQAVRNAAFVATPPSTVSLYFAAVRVTSASYRCPVAEPVSPVRAAHVAKSIVVASTRNQRLCTDRAQ